MACVLPSCRRQGEVPSSEAPPRALRDSFEDLATPPAGEPPGLPSRVGILEPLEHVNKTGRNYREL